jgi:DNA invertase Pin-like site-specific DNA recombinase
VTVFAGMADFEQSLIVERTSGGRVAAKARGVRFGPRQLATKEGKSVSEVARLLGVRRATLYRALNSGPETASA